MNNNAECLSSNNHTGYSPQFSNLNLDDLLNLHVDDDNFNLIMSNYNSCNANWIKTLVSLHKDDNKTRDDIIKMIEKVIKKMEDIDTMDAADATKYWEEHKGKTIFLN